MTTNQTSEVLAARSTTLALSSVESSPSALRVICVAATTEATNSAAATKSMAVSLLDRPPGPAARRDPRERVPARIIALASTSLSQRASDDPFPERSRRERSRTGPRASAARLRPSPPLPTRPRPPPGRGGRFCRERRAPARHSWRRKKKRAELELGAPREKRKKGPTHFSAISFGLTPGDRPVPLAHIEAWPPPGDDVAFESLCLDLWREIWGPDSGAQKNGRRGQPQAGVD